MAIGLLGSLNTFPGVTGATVYTVPAGISHAVVHITLSTFSAQVAFVEVNSAVILYIASGSTLDTSRAVSMMLSPGDTVTVTSNGGGGVTVSGYEVP